MSLEHILLGMLDKPRSGYELGREFERGPAHYWFARLSQIYPTLKRMEHKGWLKSCTEPPESGPERIVYTVTRYGRDQLQSWLRAGPKVRRERFEYLAQLRFLHKLGDPDETAAFIRSLREELAVWLEELHAIERELLEVSGGWQWADEDTFHAISAVRMGINSLNAKVTWCDEILTRLKERQIPGEAGSKRFHGRTRHR